MTLPKPQNVRRILSSSSTRLTSSPSLSPSSPAKLVRKPSLVRRESSIVSVPMLSSSPSNHPTRGYIVVGVVCLLLLVVYQAWVVSKLQQYGTGCGDKKGGPDDGFFVQHSSQTTTTTTIPPIPNDKSSSSSPKVGLCTITTDAIRFLDEWIDYHLFAMKFYEIYLFDNSDTFELKYYQHPFATTTNSDDDDDDDGENNSSQRRQQIYTTHFPGYGALHQRAAYELCILNYGHRVDYMAFWDDDEFLVLHNQNYDSVGDFVKDHLMNGSSLTINWRIFGTSNHSHYRPLPLVTQRFVYRSGTDARVKSIVRPQDFKYMINPHAVKLRGQKAHRGHRYQNKTDKWSNMYYNQNGTHRWRDVTGGGNYTWDGSRNYPATLSGDESTTPPPVAVLHHYKYKSEEEWEWKMCYRLGFSRMPHKDCGTVPMVGHIFDDTAWQTLKRRVPRYAALEPWS